MEYFILDAKKDFSLNEIDEIYTSLARGQKKGQPNPNLKMFLTDLHSRYPHDTVPYADPDLKNYPWKSSDYETYSNGMVLSFSSPNFRLEIIQFIQDLCRKYELILYNPENGEIL